MNDQEIIESLKLEIATLKAGRTPNLNKALAKAQGAIRSAEKDGTNPHLRSSYSTLSSVIDAAKRPFSDNGLSIIQPSSTEIEGDRATIVIETILLHESGEERSSVMRIIVNKGRNSYQELGTAQTYGRRYSYMAMAGIAPGDDSDGESEASQQRNKPQQRPNPPTQRPPQKSEPKQPKKYQINSGKWEDKARQKRFFAQLGSMGLDYGNLKKFLNNAGKPNPSVMINEDLDALLSFMTTKDFVAMYDKWMSEQVG